MSAHDEELPEPDVTPETHPNHHVVGREFMGWDARRWFAESHDHCGYWMYATDGSGDWSNISERAVGRTYHEIYELDGRKFCSWGRVRSYTELA